MNQSGRQPNRSNHQSQRSAEGRSTQTGQASPPKPESSSLFCRIREAFHVFARQSSNVLGTPWSFILALTVIVAWAVTGPMFHYSDTWQLVINTGTTIVTFLMVFLIQNTQNRDAKAVHLKLDELIRALKGARNHLVDLEKLSDDELSKLEKEFERIHTKADRAKRSVSRIEREAEEEA
jgi:low affinity Fe/Cu permease